MGRVLAMDGVAGRTYFKRRRNKSKQKNLATKTSKTKIKIKAKATNSKPGTKYRRNTPNKGKCKEKVTIMASETKSKAKVKRILPMDGDVGIKRFGCRSRKKYKKAIPSAISQAKTRAAAKSILRAKTELKPGPKPRWKKPGPKPKPKTPLEPVNALYGVDEKVLCYEPDPTKARILYEAKVLQVVKKVNRGRPAVEYLIHFQGWNSSWDRFVSESLILKDDETSRGLQLKLAEEAEAIFQATAPKSSKKRGRTIADLVRASLRGNNLEEPEAKTEKEASSEDSEEEPDDNVEVDFAISHAVRMSVDLDYFLINKYEKLSQVPAEPNIIQILEEYVRYFGFQQLSRWVDSITASALAECSSSHNVNKSSVTASSRKTEDSRQHPMEKLYNRLRVVMEVVDGVRILIDFLLHTILLYSVEREQFEKSDDKAPIYRRPVLKSEDLLIRVKSNPVPESEVPPPPKKCYPLSRSKSCPLLERHVDHRVVNAPLKKLAATMNPLIRVYKMKLLKWSLVPQSIYERVPSLPSLIYGPNFLLRLFVKLPEVFSKMTIPRRKLRIIIHYISDMIDFVMKSGFCGPHLYMPAKNALKRVGRRRRQQSVPIIRVEQPGSDEEEEIIPTLKKEKK